MIVWLRSRSVWLSIGAIAIWCLTAALYMNNAALLEQNPVLGWAAFVIFILPIILAGEIVWLIWRRISGRIRGGQG